MISQRNGRKDINSRFAHVEKITTSDLALEPGETETVEAAAAGVGENQFMNQAGQNQNDSIRRTRQVNSTLLEFPNKRQQKNADEWRDEIKNRVKQRKEGKTGDLVETVEMSRHSQASEVVAEPTPVVNLKPKIADPKPAPTTGVAARALERVARSRQQFEQAGGGGFDGGESAVQAANLQSDAPPLTLVPNQAVTTATAKTARKITMPFDADDFGGGADFRDDYLSVQQTAAPEFQESAASAAPTEIPISRRKNIELETARESYAAVADLEDEDSIQASLGSVRKTKSALDGQQPETRSAHVGAAARHQRKQLGEDFAPLGKRFAAGAIDLGIGAGAVAATVYALGLWQPISGIENYLLPAALFFAVEFLYLTILPVLSGTTIGLKAFRLGIVHAEDGYIPTFAQAAINSLVYLLVLATGGIGLLTVFLGSEKRALHNIAAGTVVVADEE